jgi:hypothetical protein
MVVGYKGGEYNMLGRYFVVRQKHAHAWVEAWLPPGAVPDSEIADTPRPSGCWYRLDPTPASTEYLAGLSAPTIQDQITDMFDYLELMWRDYVVNLNSLRQHQAVVDPATASALDFLPQWIDARSTDRWFRQLSQRLGLPVPRRPVRAPGRLFDWRLAAVVMGAMVLVIALAQLGAAMRRWLPSWLGWHDRRGSFHQPPTFYRRLEALLARMHLRRDRGQTASEFAEAAREKLAVGALPEVAQLPPEIVQAYYRVRFGGESLDNSQTVAVEKALAQLAPAVGSSQP